MNRPSPRVFISYSWSSAAHEQWVIDLAEKLTADGVHVVLDKWDLKEGQDKYAFMERLVTDAEVRKVLMICDRLYAEKADGRKGGVGTESQIISPEVYAKADQEKFIPVVAELTEEGQPYLPAYLKGRIYVDLAREDRYADEYERLLRNIYNRPAFERPPMGTPPSYLDEEATPQLKTGHKFARFREAVTNSRPHCRPSAIDYLESLLSTYPDFVITGDAGTEPDEQVLARVEDFKPYRDQFVEFIFLCARYGADPSYFEKVVEFLEWALSYHYPAKEVRQCNELWFDQYRFIHWELFLYLIAALIKERALDTIDLLLDEQYFYSTNTEKRSDRFAVFDSYVRSLEEYRKRRLKLNRICVAADLIRDRADNKSVLFEDIMQADLVLALRSVLGNGADDYWYPRTLVFAERRSGFDLFLRGQSHRHFEVVKRLLKVQTKEDLMRRFQEAQSSHLRGWNFDGWPIPFAAYINLEKLDTV